MPNLPKETVTKREMRQSITTRVRTKEHPNNVIGTTVNLSTTGANLEIKIDVQVDDYLDIDIAEIVDVRARVVRADGSRIGVQFVDIGRDQEQRIRDYIAKIERLRYS